jgi:hypothetical protein
VLTFLGLASPAIAQVNTGTVEVTTIDETQAPIAGVSVSVINQETGLTRVSESAQRGESIFSALPPGPYDIRIVKDGFAPAEQDITLLIGQTARVHFSLKVQVSDAITVTGAAPVVDILRQNVSTNITPEQIRELPVPSREFENLAFIAPGSYRERGNYRFIQDRPLIGAAGNASQSSIIVDGVDLTDQTFGLARARFSNDAIREFRVVTARFDPEIGLSQGGALNVVTKSGGNEVQGSAFAFYRAADLRATGALEESDGDFSRLQVGFTIGGPFTSDRTHYFVSAEQIDENRLTLFRPGGAFVDLADDPPQDFGQTLCLGGINHMFSPASNAFAKLVYERFRMNNFRVGGVSDVSNGVEHDRDNWNLTIGTTHVFGDGHRFNEARLQIGRRDTRLPTNSDDTEEWFTGGGTLRIGANTLGDQVYVSDRIELRNTFHWQMAADRTIHDLKLGAAWLSIEERFKIPTYEEGILNYATDTRDLPIWYFYGTGSAEATKRTDVFSVFVNDNWRLASTFTLSLGIRYDYDTQGNNPDFDGSPLVGERTPDKNNLQPRLGFSWDVGNDGKNLLRGGAGVFTGRYLLTPALFELVQNGSTGWVIHRRMNGRLYGLPPETWLDPDDPENTGILAPQLAQLLEDSLRAPETTQASVGYTRALGRSGLYFDIEALYGTGRNEITRRDTNWRGNDNPGYWDPDWSFILKHGNEGHSEYKTVVVGLNGTVGNGHMLTSSLIWADKRNISDDLNPVLPYEYPSDPADMEAEWGRSRGTESWRFVFSGVFRLPARFTVGTTYIYGSGQPWNRLLGYDYNGDLFVSDRFEGEPRNGENGPRFSQLNLRITWTLRVGGGGLDLMAEAFNLFNTTNYDVNSIDNLEFFSGPTIGNPSVPYSRNPNFARYRATLEPLEIQLGLRWWF